MEVDTPHKEKQVPEILLNYKIINSLTFKTNEQWQQH